MALVNEAKLEVLAMLEERLEVCVENEFHINIHLSDNHVEVRNCIIIEDIDINEEEVNISGCQFYFCVDLEDIEEIQFISEDNSFYLRFNDGMEVYLDLMTK